MVRLLGMLLLACAAGAWGLAVFGQCPVQLGVALSLMCCGLAWALVPLWVPRDASPDVSLRETPAAAVTIKPPKAEAQRRQRQAVSQLSSGTVAPNARDHAQRFGRAMLEPADVDTPVVKLHSAYLEWCAALGEVPCATREIGTELAALFQRVGIEIVDVDGTYCVSRARVRSKRGSAVLGSMTTIGVTA